LEGIKHLLFHEGLIVIKKIGGFAQRFLLFVYGGLKFSWVYCFCSAVVAEKALYTTTRRLCYRLLF